MKKDSSGPPDPDLEALRGYRHNPDAAGLLSLNFGFARARVLDTALELGVFRELAAASGDAAELARALACSRDGTERLLDALAELGLVEETDDGRYVLTPVSRAYLVQGGRGYLGQHFSAVMEQWNRWAALTDVVRSGLPRGDSGSPVNRGCHPGLFAGLFPVAVNLAYEVASRLQIPAEPRVLDVTAGSGEWGIALALTHDTARVTAHDDAALLGIAREHVQEFGLTSRFSFASATFDALPFQDRHFDVAVFAHMGRFAGAGTAALLLRECSRVLCPGGKLIIVDVMRPSRGEPTLSRAMLNLSLLINTRSGEVPDRAEYRKLMENAGIRPDGEFVNGPVAILTGER